MLAIMRHISLPICGGELCYFSEAFSPGPRYALRIGSREFMERGYPADACGAICLSFRALGNLSAKNLANLFGDEPYLKKLDSGFLRNDRKPHFQTFYDSIKF